MYEQPMTASDKRWQAESDANTLAEAQVIANNPERMTAAKAAAKRIADEQADRTQSLRKVAGKKAGTKPYVEKTGVSRGPAPNAQSGGSPDGMAAVPVTFLKNR